MCQCMRTCVRVRVARMYSYIQAVCVDERRQSAVLCHPRWQAHQRGASVTFACDLRVALRIRARLTIRDLPPRGGYAPIRYKRNLPAKGPSGVMLIFMTVGITAFGFWRLGLGNIERRYVHGFIAESLMSRELARERAWSRIYLAPLLLAEFDRDTYRRERASTLREELLMKNVPGFEVRGFSEGTTN